MEKSDITKLVFTFTLCRLHYRLPNRYPAPVDFF